VINNHGRFVIRLAGRRQIGLAANENQTGDSMSDLSPASKLKPASNTAPRCGPHTARGKAHSARNALRHGLNIPVAADPATAAAVEALTNRSLMDSIAGALKWMFWSVRNSIAAVIRSSLAENTSYEPSLLRAYSKCQSRGTFLVPHCNLGEER
jgi:hypothetical protein